MSDLISRKAAIDILCRLHIDNIAVNGKRITEFIRELPSVTDTNVGDKWIPCSERLPTEKEAWDYNAEDDLYEPNEFIVQVKGAKLPTVAMFDGETFTHGYAEDGYGFMDKIIAWMPLPPVYEGE